MTTLSTVRRHHNYHGYDNNTVQYTNYNNYNNYNNCTSYGLMVYVSVTCYCLLSCFSKKTNKVPVSKYMLLIRKLMTL